MFALAGVAWLHSLLLWVSEEELDRNPEPLKTKAWGWECDSVSRVQA